VLMESGSSLPAFQEQTPGLHIIAAALADMAINNPQSKIENEPDPYSPWKVTSGFRIGGARG